LRAFGIFFAYNHTVAEQFVTCALDDIIVGEPLPTTLYVYIDFRFITFRAEGDTVDRATFDRLQFKQVKNLFISEKDLAKFRAWSKQVEQDKPPALAPANKAFVKAREEVKRKTLDVFLSQHPDRVVTQTLQSSKKLVAEVMKFPYAVKTLQQLQTYSQGTADHSVNVSILSVYLAMQMGYSHSLILQHVGAGGLLHDIGKPRCNIGDDDPPNIMEAKNREHPTMGLRLLEAQQKVPNEVKMIISQHHENYDGSGYPKKLKGNAIYDLTRIVAIANAFDGLVADGKGTLVERQKAAINSLDQVLYKRFDPQKLDKALKILKLGV
jgi:putative nucleotidyltransferase with HDIG domain